MVKIIKTKPRDVLHEELASKKGKSPARSTANYRQRSRRGLAALAEDDDSDYEPPPRGAPLRGIGEESARRRRRRRRMNPKSNLVHPEPFLQTIQLGILGNAPAMRIMNRKMNILHLESFLNANRLRRLGDASAMRIMNRKTNILHLESFLNANRL